jgi:hypothetical protein
MKKKITKIRKNKKKSEERKYICKKKQKIISKKINLKMFFV